MIDDLSNLVLARRVMLSMDRIRLHKEGKEVGSQTAEEAFEEDQLLLSGSIPDTQPVPDYSPAGDENSVQINLSQLTKTLKEIESASPPTASSKQNQITAAFLRTDISIRYQSFSKVDGIVLHNKNLAETDRYLLSFSDGATFKITDKWSGKSTTIWGDPHIDTSDQEGNSNGEFSDLTTSNTHTTLMLEDGTRVTFTALDNGVINRVDVFKEHQHLGGIGSASPEWKDSNGLFNSRIDTQAEILRSSIPTGDTVFAGGDGADWFDASGRLVWGKITGPHIANRPTGVVEFDITYHGEILVRANEAKNDSGR